MENKTIRPSAFLRKGECKTGRINDKDSEITPIPQTRYGQLKMIEDYLGDTSTDGHTRMQVSKATGIERASVCRRVAILRREGKVWSCGKRLDPITGCRAEYLTTNQNVALRHFVDRCLSLLEGMEQDTQLHILEVLKAYVLGQPDDFNIVNLPDIDEVRIIWETQVKPRIDRELT